MHGDDRKIPFVGNPVPFLEIASLRRVLECAHGTDRGPGTHTMTTPTCDHFGQLTATAEPASNVCDRCVAMGDTWVHLRSCLECGMVGCCDNSKNRHARAHWEEVGHPLIRSIERGETWQYCFPDHFLKR